MKIETKLSLAIAFPTLTVVSMSFEQKEPSAIRLNKSNYSYLSITKPLDFSEKLEQAHVFFRHGDRTPMELASATKTLRNEWIPLIQEHPFGLLERSHAYGNEYPFGQLTQKGK